MFVKQNRLLVALGQIFLLGSSAILAWLLRFDFTFPNAQVLFSAMPILIGLRVLGMAHFGLFDGKPRYPDIGDALSVLKAVASTSLGFFVVERWVLGEARFPLSVYCIEMVLSAFLLLAVRTFYRASRVDLGNDTDALDQLRDVNAEDLLGRDPVRLDMGSISSRIAGRIIMVTGAAGSIGSELCRQLLPCSPLKLVCIDRAETPLFNLQNAQAGSRCEVAYCVADITDAERMRDVIHEHQVQVIFHAAGYKHVPLMEENLHDAINNNVFGLFSLIEVADQAGCEDFLLISSDKAVHPASIMGCTKRIGELIVATRPSQMRCVAVRFGNVLGSQGSVLPLFQKQIRLKRTITVTHPDITRYFITIPEAASLLLQAFSIGEKRDILVLDMGKPMRILDLAKTLIRLSGLRQSEVKISFIGLRPGEKLSEDLFYGFETPLRTSARKVLRAQGQTTTWPALLHLLSELRSESATGIPDRVRAKVKEIVPEYLWTESHADPYVQAASSHELRRFCEQTPLANAND